MKRSTRQQLLMSLTACLLSSCVIYTPTVPDMPYQGTAGRTTYPDTWMTTQPTGIEQAPIPEPVASQPITTSAANAPLDLTKPVAPGTMKLTTPAPEPKVTPAPVKKAEPALEPIVSTASSTPKPAAAASTATDLSQITNTGPIPVAMRVPGDPTRVYNPLNPNKTIRVVDKDGKPFPSGKKLKVRGTNFMFYVP